MRTPVPWGRADEDAVLGEVAGCVDRGVGLGDDVLLLLVGGR